MRVTDRSITDFNIRVIVNRRVYERTLKVSLLYSNSLVSWLGKKQEGGEVLISQYRPSGRRADRNAEGGGSQRTVSSKFPFAPQTRGRFSQESVVKSS